MEAKKLAEQHYTYEEYLALEQAQDIRHEYYAGSIFAMAGGSLAHNRIARNLANELDKAAGSDTCGAFLLDTRLEIEPKGKYFYPDVVYTCHAQDMNWGKKNHISRPVLIAEVLSPSTEDHDRNGKFKAYLAMPGLLYYLLLSQDQYSVEVYERQPADNWIYSHYNGLDALIQLPLIGMELRMEELYKRVALEEKESE